MKYLKEFESYHEDAKLYFTNKFLVVKPKNDPRERTYLLEVIYLHYKTFETRKHYTLVNGKVKKDTKHQLYYITLDRVQNDCIYYSDNIKTAYDIMMATVDAGNYNL
jgi:hypothetical protein